MNHLRREQAPITATTWDAIDAEAQRALRNYLSARRVVDFSGPHGWAYASVSLGRTRRIGPPGTVGGDTDRVGAAGVGIGLRESQPITEVRRTFALPRTTLDEIDRGNRAADLQPVVDASAALAAVEDRAVFHGLDAAGIIGMVPASPHEPVPVDPDDEEYPRSAARALAALRRAGVEGPYAIALGARAYTGVIETTHGGYPVLEHLRLILGGPVVWAPALEEAAVVSLRGGDFELIVGEDFSVGYDGETDDTVTFVLEETMTFCIYGAEAAVPLVREA